MTDCNERNIETYIEVAKLTYGSIPIKAKAGPNNIPGPMLAKEETKAPKKEKQLMNIIF